MGRLLPSNMSIPTLYPSQDACKYSLREKHIIIYTSLKLYLLSQRKLALEEIRSDPRLSRVLAYQSIFHHISNAMSELQDDYTACSGCNFEEMKEHKDSCMIYAHYEEWKYKGTVPLLGAPAASS